MMLSCQFIGISVFLWSSVCLAAPKAATWNWIEDLRQPEKHLVFRAALLTEYSLRSQEWAAEEKIKKALVLSLLSAQINNESESLYWFDLAQEILKAQKATIEAEFVQRRIDLVRWDLQTMGVSGMTR